MGRFVIAICLTWLLSGSGSASDVGDPVLPSWMAGCWRQEIRGRWSEECWTTPRAGIMLGSGRTGIGDTLKSWETMQIQLNVSNGSGTSVRMGFFGAPGGSGRTLFAWQPTDKPGVTFFNVGNDYPQRIRYWRDGDTLMAEVSLADGSKPMRWRYLRAD